MTLTACGGKPTASRFTPCPASPNCVSSLSSDQKHYIAPFSLRPDATAGWTRLKQLVLAQPRTRLVTEEADYLHFECRSLIFRFVDDLEFRRDPATTNAHVRSASRLGYSDLGVNRRRVESIRALYQKTPGRHHERAYQRITAANPSITERTSGTDGGTGGQGTLPH